MFCTRGKRYRAVKVSFVNNEMVAACTTTTLETGEYANFQLTLDDELLG